MSAQYLDGDHAVLTITVGGKPVLSLPLESVLPAARFGGNPELLRYSYQPIDEDDPATPTEPRKYARLLVEEMPAPVPPGRPYCPICFTGADADGVQQHHVQCADWQRVAQLEQPPTPGSPEYGAWLAQQYRHVPLPAPAGEESSDLNRCP